MNDQEINVAIAEWRGEARTLTDKEFDAAFKKWMDEKPHPHAQLTRPKRVEGIVANYTSDLNAMHEAEEKLTNDQWMHYEDILEEVTKRDSGGRFSGRYWIHATAHQRAEALLRTIGKWKD